MVEDFCLYVFFAGGFGVDEAEEALSNLVGFRDSFKDEPFALSRCLDVDVTVAENRSNDSVHFRGDVLDSRKVEFGDCAREEASLRDVENSLGGHDVGVEIEVDEPDHEEEADIQVVRATEKDDECACELVIEKAGPGELDADESRIRDRGEQQGEADVGGKEKPVHAHGEYDFLARTHLDQSFNGNHCSGRLIS